MRTRTVGWLSVMCAVTLFFACSGDRQSNPTPVVDIAAANGGDGTAAAQAAVPKVTICHIPPGNPANAHTITVGAPAVPAHVANHGDSIGPCPVSSPSPTPFR